MGIYLGIHADVNIESLAGQIAAVRDRGVNEKRVYFYEREFYCLSNFSAFRLGWCELDFDTAEAAYHWTKFPGHAEIRNKILWARSAHEAFKIAESQKALLSPAWDRERINVMRQILRAKARQHEYVRRKLLETGDRELVENSWRDSFWGWGENLTGKNMLGQLWMEIRDEIRIQKSVTRVCQYPLGSLVPIGNVAVGGVLLMRGIRVMILSEAKRVPSPESPEAESVMTIGVDDHTIREFTCKANERVEYLGTATMNIRIDDLKA